MIQCLFEAPVKGTKCVYCGFKLPTDFTSIPGRNCPRQQSALLGDRIEQTLKALGFTPEFYAHARQVVALLPDCNCTERKEILNEIHAHAKEHGWPSATTHAKQIRDKIKADREPIAN